MNKRQKQIAAVAAGAVLLYLVYRWWQGSQGGASGATQGAVAPDTAASDYASLAGQEQADAAALQGQNTQLYSQEQSDIAGLQGQISGFGGQISGFADQLDQLTGGQNTLQGQIAALATGAQPVDRAQAASVQTHKGGPFYNYYVHTTGHAPPATVRSTNFVYQAWKSGVRVTAAAAHPSSRNTQVAHPNGQHKQQAHVPPAQQHKPPPKPAQQPRAPTPVTRSAPTKPPAKTKPKKSGVRK